MENKKNLGQYFTIQNPFHNQVFKNWLNNAKQNILKNYPECYFYEPFVGSGNIVKMIEQIDSNTKWKTADIDDTNLSDDFKVKYHFVKENSIEKMNVSKNSIIITNPPYLGKSSASKQKLTYNYPEYDDLYKKCLEIMLKNCDYVSAIIPESFITSKLFTERIDKIISITNRLFNDTKCPVCLALFSKKVNIDKKKVDIDKKSEYSKNNYTLYRNETLIGNILDIQKNSNLVKNNLVNIQFNVKDGNLGIICVDNTKGNSICFCESGFINPDEIKVSSRTKTRVKVDIEITDKFINECNLVLNEYRKQTQDIFLTSFKGLRKDNMYRRRLDFKTARMVINTAFKNLEERK